MPPFLLTRLTAPGSLRMGSPLFLMKNWKFTPFCFSAKQSKIKCFVSLQIEIQPFKTKNASIQKSGKLAFFQGGQSMVFGQKLKILFLFSFSVIQSETRCFVTFWIENLPIQTRKTLILKSRKLAFFHFFGQKQETMVLFSFSAK